MIGNHIQKNDTTVPLVTMKTWSDHQHNISHILHAPGCIAAKDNLAPRYLYKYTRRKRRTLFNRYLSGFPLPMLEHKKPILIMIHSSLKCHLSRTRKTYCYNDSYAVTISGVLFKLALLFHASWWYLIIHCREDTIQGYYPKRLQTKAHADHHSLCQKFFDITCDRSSWRCFGAGDWAALKKHR